MDREQVVADARGVERVEQGGDVTGRADADFVKASTGFSIGGVAPQGSM